ncbi:helix-turn-helix domain-containing protein [Malaciobacter molluscorum LMG 25693]|uniref:Helix-turn-helix domain-containing protein n=1 Tax=Malaciobacter molluscorum LMG 25693 TaxID=870501 RepID=A0A2G1DJ87_9BACT|nr:winged helix-turn-helix domain-containing protein [Malaciobacter molluscorum]AXX91694.1 signal transduction response regulator [Malaciobacter molluscorum LMG 25693]PHO18510.1 helix-turn-helix domain-containing protein [Malaciobacter molluscorum LMG 25693]
MNAIKILVLESVDSNISQIIKILKDNNFQIKICNDNNEFFECIYNNLYDLYIININQMSLSRFHLIKLLNDFHDMTMKMVITSASNIIVPSFIYGCDECIIKNIDKKEILLRIKALIRRQFHIHTDRILLKKNISYDIFSKKVLKNDEELFLGEKAQLILDYLLKYRGNFVSSSDLESAVYPVSNNCKNGSIRFHIHKIRQLIGNDVIISNRTNGYKIDE